MLPGISTMSSTNHALRIDGGHSRMQDRQRRVSHVAAISRYTACMRHTAASREPKGELAMTEMTRRLLLAGAAAAPFAGWVRLADAATPKDTAVFAKQIDDIISLDPGESYELSGQEICTNVYDRLLRYEAEDLSKLVGGVAESWTVAPIDKTPAFLLTQLGWSKATVKDLVKGSSDTLTATITADFAPSLVLNLMTSVVASVVEK